ncbi:hypothetical protein FAZ19_04405 [Sphingobacterium alkalisoli]|uniref:histidine kinase n=1 Tax=Sphingobacterium alkalisoli TaxID=1874115 RepID=A0A4U0HCZ8_9SPHI|nr:sensor histidine kinase [Sphingobacterium alkalisoli]TJY68502.1 hypothetical protein FAZ19_04405 [Sphingobacterium alkalisoli]GGH06033.1 hypothetical protein GCM10011418_02540 [Sphingobacterium alkalisoli]
MQLLVVPRVILLVFLSLSTVQSVYSGEEIVYRDTFEVSGANTTHLSRYVSYWLDSSKTADVTKVDKAYQRDLFMHWPLNANLNVGLNPYPLWLHLHVKHTALQKTTYWWSFYNQADTVLVYQKEENGNYVCTDTLSYMLPMARRKTHVRFQAIPLSLDSSENRTILVKVINLRTPQSFVTDFTSPRDNLLWEQKFYWSVGVFAGCFLFALVGSLIAAVVARERILWIYALYVLTVVFLLFSQELLITILPDWMFFLSIRIHPLLVVLVGLSLYGTVVCYVLDVKTRYPRLYRALRRINLSVLGYGLLTTVGYLVFYTYLTVQSKLYVYAFYIHVNLVLVMLGITLGVIVFVGLKGKYIILHIVIGCLVIYFNPASYYLNYEGLINYYQITYPNYFYWILCLEFIVFGGIISWRYRKTRKQNHVLFQEKVQQDKKAYLRELQIQEDERLQIARDLHDDLGATLSAIKLVTTNSYPDDKHLTAMVVKANTDLRHFFSKLTEMNLKEKGFFSSLDERVEELNASGDTVISFISVGDEELIPESIPLPLFRIISELLSNILKHAKASEAIVQLIVETDHIQLLTEDNGIGYDTHSAENKGMGLRNIQDRVARLDGKIHVSSNTSGTTSIIIIPL